MRPSMWPNDDQTIYSFGDLFPLFLFVPKALTFLTSCFFYVSIDSHRPTISLQGKQKKIIIFIIIFNLCWTLSI